MSFVHATSPAAWSELVARQPNHCAMIAEDGRHWSYSELDTARIKASKALIYKDIKSGDRVAVWAQNTAEWVIAGLAIHSVGAALVPLNTRLKGPEADYILQASQAKLLFSCGEFLNQYYPSLINRESLPALENIVVFSQARASEIAWDDFLALSDQTPDAAVRESENAVTAGSIMDIMFTSGTTGKPKGVITHHGQNLKVIAEWCQRMAITPEDKYLIANPFFHAFGYKVGWLGGLLSGCTILPHAVFDAGQIIARISEHQVSVLPGPPTIFVSLLDDPALKGGDFSSLRATITGAAAVAPSLIERVRKELGFEIVLTGYGLTETCGIVSLCDPNDSAETIVSTCGKPVPDTEVRIVDADNQPVAQGDTGEIVVRGYNVMQQYLDNPSATAETIDPDGWLHTGDIGLLDEHGYIRITDRLKDMFICGGFNCYPAEIEGIMAAHPAISQVAVVGMPHERMGEVGKAFVVAKPGHTVDPSELVTWCREQMANYKAPRQVIVVDSLPMNASGKVLKFELREKG
ncbi:MAG: FadD3 family acyl-CoA ligase [Oceanococcus sp.]